MTSYGILHLFLKNKRTPDVNAKANKVLNPKATTTAQKKTMINSFETKVQANKVLGKKAKGISVFDFDDTLAKTKEKIIVTNVDGTVTEISASDKPQMSANTTGPLSITACKKLNGLLMGSAYISPP